MKKMALIGLVAVSALMVGCSSTQCRDGSDCGDCDSKCETACETACNHTNTTFECANADCKPGAACCGDCAKKMAEMCPDCAKHAKTCGPDCTKPCCAT